MNADAKAPLVSVIVLNYNGAQWIERCLESLRLQTISAHCEVIVADNVSTDGSNALARNIVGLWPNGVFLQHDENLGYCEGNNRAAAAATGRYLFFLNNDAWLEPDCLERLVSGMESHRAQAACPLVLNYEDDSFQSMGAGGFDIFGLPTARQLPPKTQHILMPEGCAYMIERRLFEELGGFDREFFMFADELDLSWRVWISGHHAMAIPGARVHHRGAAQVNPRGGGTVVEFRTSDTKRFYANRNSLLVLLKNAQHVLFLHLALQIVLLAVEAVIGLLLVRRWNFVRRAYASALFDCWRLRRHICCERRRIKGFRKVGDFKMLRFLRWPLNRYDELKRMRQYGIPKVTPK